MQVEINVDLIKQLAVEGRGINQYDAMVMLGSEYVKWCGISIGYRTLVFDGAIVWQDSFLTETEHPLAKRIKEEYDCWESLTPVLIWHLFTPDFTDDILYKYDICPMRKEDYMDCLLEWLIETLPTEKKETNGVIRYYCDKEAISDIHRVVSCGVLFMLDTYGMFFDEEIAEKMKELCLGSHIDNQ